MKLLRVDPVPTDQDSLGAGASSGWGWPGAMSLPIIHVITSTMGFLLLPQENDSSIVS